MTRVKMFSGKGKAESNGSGEFDQWALTGWKGANWEAQQTSVSSRKPWLCLSLHTQHSHAHAAPYSKSVKRSLGFVPSTPRRRSGEFGKP